MTTLIHRIRKAQGAHYMSVEIASFLSCWAIGRRPAVVLDPTCGDGFRLEIYAGNSNPADRYADYAMPESLVIATGQRSGAATITIVNDAMDVGDETLSLGVFVELGAVAI